MNSKTEVELLGLTEFDTLRLLAKKGDPVDMYIVGGSISQAEKRFPEKFNSNDYFTSYQVKLGRPVSVTDAKGLSDMNKKLAMALGLATQVNRRCEKRDGLGTLLGSDIGEVFRVEAGAVKEGLIPAGQESKSTMIQMQEALGTPVVATVVNDGTTPPAAEETKKKTVRKRKVAPANVPASAPAQQANLEEVL